MKSDKALPSYILLSFGFLFLSLYWQYLSDFVPAHVDDTNYFIKAYELFNLAKTSFSDLIWGFFNIHKDKPPLVIYYFSTLIALFGKLGHKFVLSLGISLLNLSLVVNLFFFFEILVKGEDASEERSKQINFARNLCLVFYTLSPLLFGVTKIACTEVMLLNFCLLTWTLGYKWQSSFDAKKALIYGLIMALGLYTKSTFVVFGAPSLIYLLRKEKGSNKLFGSSFKYFILGLISCVPWYLSHLFEVIGRAFTAAHFSRHDGGEIYLPCTYLNYLEDLNVGLGSFTFGLFVILIILNLGSLKKFFKEEIRSKSYLYYIFLTCFGYFIAFFFVSNKNERFQFIAIFFIIFLIALFLSSLTRRLEGKALSSFKAFLILLLVAQGMVFWDISFKRFLPKLRNPHVMYATRPYSAFFSSSFEEKLKPLIKDGELEIRIRKSITDVPMEEAELQPERKNPRSLLPHLKLLQARLGRIVMDYPRKDLRKENKKLKDYLLFVSKPDSKFKEIKSIKHGKQRHEFSYQHIEILESQSDDYRFDLYKLASES